MLNKLFKQKSVPSIQGKIVSVELEKRHFAKAFEIELANMQETPVYPLTNQLTIGSEIGNIVISDPSISPRHASFILQDEVVSVLDHGSVAGTLINGQKIQPGKYVILEESDSVNVGDLEVKLRVKTVEAPVQVIPDIPSEEKVEIEKVAPIKQEVKPFTPKVGQKKTSHESTKNLSANALVRVFSVLSDFLLSYSLLVILLPFDDFRNLIHFIPETLSSMLSIEWSSLWTAFAEDYGFLAGVFEDIFKLISGTFDFVPLFVMFALVRLTTTLILGVSISEFLLGVRPTGNMIWARVGGVLRVLIGFITGPFLLFDSPSIISRRTLKEFMSFTNIQTPSTFVTILGFIFYLPLLVVLVLFSPLLQGLEAPQAITINDKIDQRVKVKVADEQVGQTAIIVKEKSERLNLEMGYDKNELTIIPNFKFQGLRNKLKVNSTLIFYQRDHRRFAEFEIFKTFDFKQLLGLGIKGNVFLFDRYPNIYNFVYESGDSNPAFKKKIDNKTQSAFGNEFIQFTKTAFSLNTLNAFDLMQEQTWLLKSFIDYKMSFLSLIEYKDFDEIGFIKIGNALFMKISYSKQKPFDLIIPLVEGEGKIFKITYDKKENFDQVASQLYKFNLNDTNWFPEFVGGTAEVMGALQVFDLFSEDNFKTLQSNEKAQALYGYYFEASSEILKKGDPIELELWKEKSMNLMKLIEVLPSAPVEEGMEDPRLKLLQNFRDLNDALINNNVDYFGITQIRSV